MIQLDKNCGAIDCTSQATHAVLAYRDFTLCCREHANQYYVLDSNDFPPLIVALPDKE